MKTIKEIEKEEESEYNSGYWMALKDMLKEIKQKRIWISKELKSRIEG